MSEKQRRRMALKVFVAWLKANELTTTDAARLIGYGYHHIRLIQKGERHIGPSFLARVNLNVSTTPQIAQLFADIKSALDGVTVE
jgi:hypothetical protein